MNFKKQCLLNACKLRNVNLYSFLKMHKIPCRYTNENKDELFFEPKEQKLIAETLDTIVPYFYGILDDKDLFDLKLTYSKLYDAIKNCSLTEYFESIGLHGYTYDIFNPGKKRNPDNLLKDHLISSLYSNEYSKLLYAKFSDLPLDEEIFIHIANTNPLSIKDLPFQTEAICLKAVSKFAYALEHVDEQTEAIALKAVQNNGMVLQFVSPELHTKKVISAALKQNPLSFRYSCLRDYDICLEAVKADGINLEFVPNEFKNHDMIMSALNSNGWGIMFLEEQTEEYALAAILQNTEASLAINEDIRNNNPHIQYIYELTKQKHNFAFGNIDKFM